MEKLKKVIKDIEDATVAASFAENNDVETARDLLNKDSELSERLRDLRFKVDAELIEVDDLTSKVVDCIRSGKNEEAQKVISEVNARLEKVNNLCRKTSSVINMLGNIFNSSDSERPRKFYYNYYKYKESLKKALSE